MAEDVSKNTVMILLILTVLVTILGTWTVLEGVRTTQIAAQKIQAMDEPSNVASAQVSFVIKEPTPPPSVTGEVIFEITPSKEVS